MAFIIKSLGANTMTAAGTQDLYTVPAGKSALVNNVRLANGVAAATPSLNLYVVPSGASARRIHDVNFTISAGGTLTIDDVVTLGQGDKLQLSMGSGGSPSVGWSVNGLERD